MNFYTDEEERFLKLIGQIPTTEETEKAPTKPTKPDIAEEVTQAPAEPETEE